MTLRENIRRALTAPCKCDFLKVHRWVEAQQAWPESRPTFLRLMKMVLLFNDGREFNSNDLGTLFHVSTKTIGRDIAFLRSQLALPISYDAKRWVYRKEVA